MKTLCRGLLFVWLLVLAALVEPCSCTRSSPDAWWLQESPEKVLAKALATNQNLTFFYAKKIGASYLLINDLFAKTNRNERTDFFQRRNSDGFVETKKVYVTEKLQRTVYKLKSGHYHFSDGQIIKSEFADGEDLEKTIADKFNRPYDCKILQSKRVGTNDCIVVARSMTPKFLDAIKAIYYKDGTKEQEAWAGGDFRNFIQSETDYYFRKSDGVAIGQITRNHRGEELEDWLYDEVEINQPIPDQEFILPQGDIKIAKSFDEFMQISGQLLAAKRAKARKDPAAILSDKRVAELPWATDLPGALRQAKAEHKIVLLDFTGSDWCMWCTRFDDDVLSKPEFASYAKTNLVMVRVDFPITNLRAIWSRRRTKDYRRNSKWMVSQPMSL
ncbi:MAG: thioredoxin family protein [Limisphaerales bacterium]